MEAVNGTLSCIALLIAATGFFVRWKMADPEVPAWPHSCVATRSVLFFIGFACAVRGIDLGLGYGSVDRAGMVTTLFLGSYSVAMALGAAKMRVPGLDFRRPAG
jgi:hypothetical protein